MKMINDRTMCFRSSVAGDVWPLEPVAAEEAPAATPDVEVETEERLQAPWRVILYNDEVHTFEEVIGQVIKATRCSVSRAEELVWRVHTEGKAAVYEGSFEECFRVQGVLREIQLVTEIEG